MSFYDYKVIPAPRRMRKVRGVRTTTDLFVLTLTEALNEMAHDGWEYIRAETLPAEAPGGWFSRSVEADQTVLVFRRPRETLGPRLAARAAEAAALEGRHAAAEAPPRNAPADRPPADRVQGGGIRREAPVRLEPRLGSAPDERGGAGSAAGATPLRPAPRLGPAEKG